MGIGSHAFAVNVKVFDVEPGFSLQGRHMNTWTERWDIILKGKSENQIVVYSRHQKLIKVMEMNDDGSIDVLAAHTNFGGKEYVSAAAGNFGDKDLAFYNRTQGVVDYYAILPTGHLSKVRTTYVGKNVEAMMAGTWTDPNIADLVLYDKFAGTLRLFAHERKNVFESFGFWGSFNFPEIVNYPPRLESENNFLMNVEKWFPGNFDGDDKTDLLAYNEDNGVGTFIEFTSAGELQVLFVRDDLPASEGTVVVPGHFQTDEGNGPLTDLLFYSRECPVVDEMCASPSLQPGCDVDYIESCVCEADPYCCDNRWDLVCVDKVQDLGCFEPFECQGVGRLLSDQAVDVQTGIHIIHNSSMVDLLTGAGNSYQWNQKIPRWNRKWTHILAMGSANNDAFSRLFFYSNQKVVHVTPVITKRNPADTGSEISTSAFQEVIHQMNRSFLPAGVEFAWNGEFYDVVDEEMAAYRCNNDPQTRKDRTHQWADWIGNRECRECLFELDPFCRDNHFDALCESGMRNQCQQACPEFDPAHPEDAPLDSLVIVLKNGGTSCSSHSSRYIVYGGWRKDTTYLSTEHGHTDRFGQPLPEGISANQRKDYNLKRLLHEVGHYFSLCHSHHGEDKGDGDGWKTHWPPSHANVRDLDLDGRSTRWPKVYDTPPSPNFKFLEEMGADACRDEPIHTVADNGIEFFVNPDPSQPMNYGNNCNGLFRFSPEQIQIIRWSLYEGFTGETFNFGGKSFLFN